MRGRRKADVPRIVENRVVLLRQIDHDLLYEKQNKTQENTLEKTIQESG